MDKSSRLRSFWAPVNAEEQALLETTGANPENFRVIARRPWTIALSERAYVPGLLVGLIVFVIAHPSGLVPAFAAAAVAGFVLTLGLAVHELGHLVLGGRARGVRPRMLVLFGGGGISILEGRHQDPRGAALFAAGGPLASICSVAVLLAGGLLLPAGPFAAALIVPAVLLAALTFVNLLPLAPMDGYLFVRSALWAKHACRDEGERRALQWSRCSITYLLLLSALVLRENTTAGIVGVIMCATFVVQHHKLFVRLTANEQRRRELTTDS
jgi:Zn-dependent protease